MRRTEGTGTDEANDLDQNDRRCADRTSAWRAQAPSDTEEGELNYDVYLFDAQCHVDLMIKGVNIAKEVPYQYVTTITYSQFVAGVDFKIVARAPSNLQDILPDGSEPGGWSGDTYTKILASLGVSYPYSGSNARRIKPGGGNSFMRAGLLVVPEGTDVSVRDPAPGTYPLKTCDDVQPSCGECCFVSGVQGNTRTVTITVTKSDSSCASGSCGEGGCPADAGNESVGMTVPVGPVGIRSGGSLLYRRRAPSANIADPLHWTWPAVPGATVLRDARGALRQIHTGERLLDITGATNGAGDYISTLIVSRHVADAVLDVDGEGLFTVVEGPAPELVRVELLRTDDNGEAVTIRRIEQNQTREWFYAWLTDQEGMTGHNGWRMEQHDGTATIANIRYGGYVTLPDYPGTNVWREVRRIENENGKTAARTVGYHIKLAGRDVTQSYQQYNPPTSNKVTLSYVDAIPGSWREVRREEGDTNELRVTRMAYAMDNPDAPHYGRELWRIGPDGDWIARVYRRPTDGS